MHISEKKKNLMSINLSPKKTRKRKKLIPKQKEEKSIIKITSKVNEIEHMTLIFFLTNEIKS